MNCIVQLRGLNASGKTTAMRQYVSNNSLNEEQVYVSGIKTWIMHNETIAVIGRYKQGNKFGGCDSSINGKQHLLNTIQTLIDTGYQVICFEGFRFSGSASISYEVERMARRCGYKFISVLMCIEYTEELRRLFNRNGGKEINLNSFDSGRLRVYRLQSEMKKHGILTMEADAQGTALDKMGNIVEDAVLFCKNGSKNECG